MDKDNKPLDSLESSESLESEDPVVETGSNVAPTAGQTTPVPTPPSNQKFDFQAFIRSLIGRINVYLLLFIFIVILSGIVFIVAIQTSKNQVKRDQSATQKLSEEALKSLQGSDTKVGDPKQLLSIESNAVFTGKVLIRDSLEVAGAIKVGGTLTLPGISVSGTSLFDQVQLNNLSVSGNATVQGQLTVQRGLSVAANGSFAGTLSAPVITTDKLVLNQDLQLNQHIDAGGPTPTISVGSATGVGGTASINGSDTAGTVTINNGGGATTGIVATVTFALRFKSIPHIIITPVCPTGCNFTPYIINRSVNEFTLAISGSNPGGSFSLSFIAIE
ncbi:hypothetical protein EB118_01500 [bacterium]|nr:hypothetical protein [bacterium]NBX98547.1 hypothetical protein [bacterium]NDC93819.1 hypothetical protein [bacterium]NDD83609.1 hypothetical protein [bacterium]NDG28765.1 hypothetical protein [bacterium]